jgi:hypothetical protein
MILDKNLADSRPGSRFWVGAALAPLLFAALLLFAAGCEEDTNSSDGTITAEAPTLDMSFPDSLTGGTSSTALQNAAAGDEPDCFYDGAGQDDPFQNGYFMTKFLVGAVATWTCVADFVSLSIATLQLPTDGQVIPTGGDPEDGPTGVSVTQDSSVQLTVRLYFNDNEEDPGFFVSWVQTDDGVDGRLILNEDVFDSDDPDEPSDMRMDFSIGEDSRSADMYIAFPAENTHQVSGFRINVARDDGDETFVAKGILAFDGQWFSDVPASITETPGLRIATISNFEGDGAASAVFGDAAVEFALGPSFSDRSLGWYLFDKDDIYFFDSAGADEWISKAVTSAQYETGKTSTSADDATIEDYLSPPLAGGEIAACVAGAGTPNQACEDILNAVFSLGLGSFVEINDSTSMPGGFRGTFISGLDYPGDYLDSPYPDGFDSWDGVFDMEFNP